MTFHARILSPTQRQVLAQLGPIVNSAGFYLGGGTAIALQLGHRQSFDFDWFIGHRLRDPLGLAQFARDHGVRLRIGQVAPGTLHGTVLKVRLSMLEYRYRQLAPLRLWRRFGCRLAALPDLAAMKLAAVAQRGARKDFVDIFALGRHGMSLTQMLRFYRRKYETDDIGHILVALAFFDEADREPMPRMLWKTDWRTMKKNLQSWVTEAAK
jgi:nucleotidyltransferase AbiEii toxin of type IV toxin-antitoxin system